MDNELLAEESDGDPTDRGLVRAALEGSRDALDELVRRQQSSIYGIAVHMLCRP